MFYIFLLLLILYWQVVSSDIGIPGSILMRVDMISMPTYEHHVLNMHLPEIPSCDYINNKLVRHVTGVCNIIANSKLC